MATNTDRGALVGSGHWRKAEKPCSSQPASRLTVLAMIVPSGRGIEARDAVMSSRRQRSRSEPGSTLETNEPLADGSSP
jgi:hypothetical protein